MIITEITIIIKIITILIMNIIHMDGDDLGDVSCFEKFQPISVFGQTLGRIAIPHGITSYKVLHQHLIHSSIAQFLHVLDELICKGLQVATVKPWHLLLRNQLRHEHLIG